MKLVNSKNGLISDVKKQFREAIKNVIVSQSANLEKVEEMVSSTLSKLAEHNFTNYGNLKVLNAEEPGCINVESELYLPEIHIEIRKDLHIFLKDIPQHKTLSMALFEYFNIMPEKCPSNFIMLECASCDMISYYQDMTDTLVESGDQGQVGCIHCGYPWLTYSYEV